MSAVVRQIRLGFKILRRSADRDPGSGTCDGDHRYSKQKNIKLKADLEIQKPQQKKVLLL